MSICRLHLKSRVQGDADLCRLSQSGRQSLPAVTVKWWRTRFRLKSITTTACSSLRSLPKYPGLPVRAIRATEAALYIGAQAVEVGLADRVETPDQLILSPGYWGERLSSPSAARAANHLEPKKMVDETEKPDVPAQPQFLTSAAIAESCIMLANFRARYALLWQSTYRRTEPSPLGR